MSFEERGENSFVINNLISGNHSTIYGGGVYCANACTVFINNTVADNICDGKGGGINIYSAFDNSCAPKLYNNIIWNNTAPEGSQIAIRGIGSSPDFYNCDMKGGRYDFHFFYNATYANNIGDYINNINTDPVFFAENDYRIYSVSKKIHFLLQGTACSDSRER
ncbi:MAG: hypothetical protein KKD38_10710 [Candidatus Delongbacteria bacterium]|nr:hypothetical protein [Candidatus Delongbacteria bacterium]MCG2761046.1 hypothetical protein [Candidatus Delongbacteria bacterium]